MGIMASASDGRSQPVAVDRCSPLEEHHTVDMLLDVSICQFDIW